MMWEGSTGGNNQIQATVKRMVQTVSKLGKVQQQEVNFILETEKVTFKVQKEKIDMKANNKHDDREGWAN